MSKRLIFLAIHILFQQCQCDKSTAIVELENILDTEHILVNSLENYVKAEEQKLFFLKSYLNIYKTQQNKAGNDPQLYIKNPLNAYTLIKRLTVDWSQVTTLISTNVNKEFFANITDLKQHIKFPTNQDLSEAATVLLRLQDTYQLDTSSLARGEINGIKYDSKLTAADCFELGRQSFNNEDYYHTRIWMEEALAQLEEEDYTISNKMDILGYLAFSTYKEGNILLALNLTNKVLELNPNYTYAIKEKKMYEDLLNKLKLKELIKKGDSGTNGNEESEDIHQTAEPLKPDNGPYNKDLYASLCRGDIITPNKLQAKLKCKYVSNNHPFLKIAPFKVEEVHLDPDLVIFHDVMSDEEIATIKNLSQSDFERVTVYNTRTGKEETTPHRVCKVTWLLNKEHKRITDIISQRVEDMTGLTMTSAEDLHIVNYEVGGHYEPHFDFVRKNDEPNSNFGNRIATVLFYMNNVAQGGATAFPKAKTAIFPKKGTAAFWYNLFPSGEGDIRTVHGGCPILAGSKWVSTKWIHAEGQEFRRMCTKERPPEYLIG